MTSHTRGPWWYDRERVAICYRLPEDSPDRYGEDDDGVRDVVNLTSAMGGTDTTADAFLMASAPDLLRALKAIILESDKLSEPQFLAAAAAVAKAERRS